MGFFFTLQIEISAKILKSQIEKKFEMQIQKRFEPILAWWIAGHKLPFK